MEENKDLLPDCQTTNDSKERFGGFISEITLNNGVELKLEKSDIIIFVGPNNVGKSHALKDMYSLTEGKNNTLIINDIKIEKSNKNNSNYFNDFLEKISIKHFDNNSINYNYLGKYFDKNDIHNYWNEKSFRQLRVVFVSYLNTENRLNISRPVESINRDENKTHPIHYLISNPDFRKKVSENFYKAFNKYITPDRLNGKTIPIRIYEKNIKINQNEYTDEIEHQDIYDSFLKECPQVQSQGDGIRSFTGVLLYLINNVYSIHLIDEPESFLHPPQANILGHIMGEMLSTDQQAFISTHSKDIIKGLLDTCPNRIKIIRITREDNKNYFSVLDNKKFDYIWKDSLLKHSEIMNSLFYNSVVLCESDSDCKLYSIILSHIKERKGQYSETLFIHCGGKHRMPKVITALKALNVKLVVVPDIDVLRDENVIKNIIEAKDGRWDDYVKDYKIINSDISNNKHNIKREKILEILNSSSENYLSDIEIKNIKNIIRNENGWDNIKNSGYRAIPSGDASNSFKTLNESFKKLGIYMVTEGELESFIKEVGKHGPEWVNNVLDRYPYFDDNVYETIRDFVETWGI